MQIEDQQLKLTKKKLSKRIVREYIDLPMSQALSQTVSVLIVHNNSKLLIPTKALTKKIECQTPKLY